MRLLIDGMNVIGSRPDGWWRDREGAIRRLIDDVRAWADEDVTVVLDSGPDDVIGTAESSEDDGAKPIVTVVRARRRGRDAADDEIVRLVQPGDGVVTSDATLADRVRARGAQVEGAGSFRRRLASPR
jgi:predicted RNA-binding protein with PIN domain